MDKKSTISTSQNNKRQQFIHFTTMYVYNLLNVLGDHIYLK